MSNPYVQEGPHKRPKHDLAGKKVLIKSGKYEDETYLVEDWQVNVYGGQSWGDAMGNAAAMEYAIRNAVESMKDIKEHGHTELDDSDDVVYGRLLTGDERMLSKMIHISQIGRVVE